MTVVANTGAELVYVGGYFYVPAGNNTTAFYRYSVSGNSWTVRTVVPATLNGDHNIVTDGTYIYVTRSGATTTHYRYSIGGNSWTTLTALPQVVNYHGFVYVSGVDKYYLFRGNGTYDVWVYNPTGDTMTQITDLPAALLTGADLTYYSGALYMVRGGSTSYYRYNISANTWTTLTVAPGSISAEQEGVVAGAYICLLYTSQKVPLPAQLREFQFHQRTGSLDNNGHVDNLLSIYSIELSLQLSIHRAKHNFQKE